MSTNFSPSATFVGGTVSAHQKVIANVAPILALNVEILDIPHVVDALSNGLAKVCSCMMNDDVGHWSN